MEKTFGGIQKSMLISAQAGRSTVRQLKQLSGAAKTSAADVEKLKKQVKTLQTELDKLNGKAGKVMPIFKKLGKVYKEHSFLIQSMTSAFFGFIQYQLIGGLRRMTDQFILMSNRVRVVNQDMKVFNTNMQNAFKIAQETRQPLFTVANTLARIGRNSAKLRTDFTRLARITSTIGKSFQIAGATIEEANNAMIQLSQAFASGRLQGDELRSVLELAPRLAQAISSSIGITVGQMRQFAKEGKLTTKVLEAAIEEASAAVDKEFSTIQKTIGQALTQVNNSLTMVVGSIDKTTKTNKALADAFTRISKAIDKLGRSRGALQVANFLKKIADNLEAILVAGSALLGTGVLAGIGVGFAAIALSLGKVSLVITAVSAAIVGLAFAFTDFGSTAKPVFKDVVGSNKAQLEELKGQVLQAREYIEEQTEKLAFAKSVKADEGLMSKVIGYLGFGSEKGTQKDLAKNIKEAGGVLERLTKRILELEKLITNEKGKQADSAMKLFLAEGRRGAIMAETLAGQQGIGAAQIRQFRKGRGAGGSAGMERSILESRVSRGDDVRQKIVEVLTKTFGVNLPDNQKVREMLGAVIGEDNKLNKSAVQGLIRSATRAFEYDQGEGPSGTSAKTGRALPLAAAFEIRTKTAETIQKLGDDILSIQLDYEDSLLSSERSQNAQTRALIDRSSILDAQLNQNLSIHELGNAALLRSIRLKQEEAEFLLLQQEGLDTVEQLEEPQRKHLNIIKDQISDQEILNKKIREQNKLLALRNTTRGTQSELNVRRKYGDQLRASDPIASAFSTGIMNIAKEFGLSMDMLKIRTDALAGSQRDVIDINTESVDLKKIDNDVLQQILEKRKKLELDAQIAKEDYSFQEQAGGIIQSGVSGSGPAASRGMQAGQAAMAAQAGGPLAMVGAALLTMVMSNKKVQAAIEKLFEMIGEVFDALIDPLGELLTDVFSGLKPIFGILKMVMKPLGKVFTSMMKV